MMNDAESLKVIRAHVEHGDSAALQRIGESIWSNIFLGANVDYIPLCELPATNGKGPRMRGCDTVLPDFDATGMRRRFYLDAKCKGHYAVYSNAGNQKRHGIDAKYWEAYTAIAAKNRQRALLGIVELFAEHGAYRWSGSILVQSLYALGEPYRQHGVQTSQFKDMVFWPVERFHCLAVGISPSELRRMSREPVTWNTSIADGLAKVIAVPERIQTQLF